MGNSFPDSKSEGGLSTSLVPNLSTSVNPECGVLSVSTHFRSGREVWRGDRRRKTLHVGRPYTSGDPTRRVLRVPEPRGPS